VGGEGQKFSISSRRPGDFEWSAPASAVLPYLLSLPKLLFFIIVSGLWREGDKNLACRAADREILNGPYRPSQSSPLYPIPSHINNLQTKLHTFSDKITHISRQNYTHFQTKLHTFSDKITHISTKLHTFLFSSENCTQYCQNYIRLDNITHASDNFTRNTRQKSTYPKFIKFY